MEKARLPADTTSSLAEFVVTAGYDSLPDTVRHEGTRAFLNIVGCTLGGSQHEAVGLTERALAPFYGPQLCTIFGRNRKTDALHAALINCMASGIYAFDDTHEQAVVHPSGPVAAAILALSETRPVTGPDFLTAFVVGVEAVCRLSKAISVPPAEGMIAWAQTGVCGGLGAAVAAGKLLRLDETAMTHAIGIALSQAAGFRAMFGTMSASLLQAQAAQTGLRAAVMAESGFTSSATALEGQHGFLSLFAERADAPALTQGLGTQFEILRNTYKPYPCGIVIHPIIEACLQLRQQHALAPESIAEVRIKTAPSALALTGRRNPQNGIEARVILTTGSRYP